METPITAWRCFTPSTFVNTSYCVRTVSARVNLGNCMRGCSLLFDGEEDTPLASASMAITKNVPSWTSAEGPMFDFNCSLVPDAQVVKSTALDFLLLSLPKVRYPMRQSRIVSPLSSLKSPRDANLRSWP